MPLLPRRQLVIDKSLIVPALEHDRRASCPRKLPHIALTRNSSVQGLLSSRRRPSA